MQIVTESRSNRVGMEEGELCVWWWREGESMDFHPVSTSDEARQLLQKLADADLADSSVARNAGGLEVYDGGEWTEWADEDGDSIDDLMREADEV